MDDLDSEIDRLGRRLDEKLASLEQHFDEKLSALECHLDAKLAAFESRLLRWMGACFAATIAILAALIQFAHR
jgi:hypothetical protein